MESYRIAQAIDNLCIGNNEELLSRLGQISFALNIKGTQSKFYCYFVKSDANGNLRLKDFIEYIDTQIVDYAIPKRELQAAADYMRRTGSSKQIISLQKKAKTLFTDLKKTGEGGEILLYILAQEILKLPQLISKMSIKTSGKLHYQGADGIHVGYDPIGETLDLYWGESKMYKSVSDAMSECFISIKDFLIQPYSINSAQERDLDLITSNIENNVTDPELIDLLVKYFDKDSDLSNSLKYKGVCFIGFDSSNYPPSECNDITVQANIEKELEKWNESLGTKLKDHSLNLKELHIFLIPLPSVEEFRRIFLGEIE